ncbi:MAG: hypothetical protein CMC86_07700 [Flavobacteriaceae bacterium]|nr:hypothetical protein [Flavobacteriaceae bacterium]
MKICFLTKIEKPGSQEAYDFLKNLNTDTDLFYGSIEDKIPLELTKKNYDILISFASPWIVPESILKKIKYRAINFHPGPPEYPGTGCFNFALYNEEDSYGSTAHIMKKNVDTGKIIGVKRFKFDSTIGVEALSILTYESMLELFKEIIGNIISNNFSTSINEKWKRKPYKRKDLDKLASLSLDMPIEKIKKRIRCTYYPGKPAPFLSIEDLKFEYSPDE